MFNLFRHPFLFSLIIVGLFTFAMAQDNKSSAIIEEKITTLLNQLSLEEKISLLHGNSIFTSAGVERLGLPEMDYTDGPFGVREETQRNSFQPAGLTSDSATFFPTGPALAATWNCDLAFRYGSAIGSEARARGKDVLLAPGVNIIRTPVCGRNFDYFTEDPFLNSRLAVAYIKGVQSQDVAACIKHYAVNNQENNRGRIDVTMDERTLREIYLPAYQAAVQEAHVLAFMGAYNKFRGAYMCENDYLLNKILKGEWSFPGIVISDWGATHSAIESALYGLDVEMGSRGDPQRMHFAAPLLEAVQNGTVDEKVIDDKARRVLRVMLMCKKDDPARLQGALNSPENTRTAYDVAAEAVILLKNSDSLLPLDETKIKSIAVIGDNATQKHASGGFGAGVKARYEVTPLEGLQKKFTKKIIWNFAQGYKKQFNESGEGWRRRRVVDNTPDSTLIAEAVMAAKSSDVAVIFAGSGRQVESEAWDRPDMQLPFGQDELIKAVCAANPNTIVVIIAGAPFDLSGFSSAVPALLWVSFNGCEGGNALADVLLGRATPSGKLPYTIPVALKDSPAHALNAYPGENNSITYAESLLVGYRWFDTKKIQPLYCFGHGLSYTRFEYLTVKTDKSEYKANQDIDVTVTVKNSGDRAGAETVQLYVTDVTSSLSRPVKELKGFSKVFLNAGEKKQVHIKLNAADLAYFDDRVMQWVVEPGDFELLVGSSCMDIRKTKRISVE